MSEINVISRTQRIIVEPVSRSVAVINAGAQGPSGAGGQKGDPGEPGGTLLSAFWQYSNTAGVPPGSGQMRSNTPLTELYVHETDTDGFNRSVGLGTIANASTILVRAANGTSMDLFVTAVPIDMGVYWKFPVSIMTGTVTKGSRTQLNFINPASTELPIGGSTGQLLAKKTNVTGDVQWVDPAVDPTAVAPVRRTMRTTGLTAVTAATTWENTMTTTTASGAVTLTLPTNASQPFPIGSEFDILQMGTGQVTFVGSAGVSVYGTPGLKLRAQYSAATAKLIAADMWIVIGDLSA